MLVSCSLHVWLPFADGIMQAVRRRGASANGSCLFFFNSGFWTLVWSSELLMSPSNSFRRPSQGAFKFSLVWSSQDDSAKKSTGRGHRTPRPPIGARRQSDQPSTICSWIGCRLSSLSSSSWRGNIGHRRPPPFALCPLHFGLRSGLRLPDLPPFGDDQPAADAHHSPST